MQQVQAIGKYGAVGGRAGLKSPFKCTGNERLAPSFLTIGGNGAQAMRKFWFNVVLHVLAVVFVIIANGAYFINSADKLASGGLGAMAGGAIFFQTAAVVGVVISTAFVFKAGNYPQINSLGIAFFLNALIFNTLAYNHHLRNMVAKEATRNALSDERITPNVEEWSYPISLFLQCYAFGAVLGNAFALAKQRELFEDAT